MGDSLHRDREKQVSQMEVYEYLTLKNHTYIGAFLCHVQGVWTDVTCAICRAASGYCNLL